MDNSVIPEGIAVSFDRKMQTLTQPAGKKKRTLEDQIKAADAEDANDMEAGESEQSKKIVSKLTESELALLFQNLSTGGIVYQ